MDSEVNMQDAANTDNTADTDADATVNVLYRELPEQDWPSARSILSFAYPDRPITLNPDTQRLIVAECEGVILAAAIVSVAYHINYILPEEATDLVRLDVLQSGAESILPDNSLYYTVVAGDIEEPNVLVDELGMTAQPTMHLYQKLKSTAPSTEAEEIAQ